MKRLFASLLLVAVFISACSTPGSPIVITEETATPTEPVSTPTPTPTHIPVDLPPAARAAMQALAAALGLSIDDITLVSTEAVDWPDGCLGIVHMGVMCTQGIVPGFRVVLSANDQQYEYHTNADGSTVTPADKVPAEPPAGLVDRVRQMLADALGLDLDAVTLASVTGVEWPNTCLGLSLPGLACADVIVPGYLVALEANGRTYAYHTNGDGSTVQPGTLWLVWERNGGIAGFCDSLALFGSGEAQALNCHHGTDTLTTTLTAEERAQLEAWVAEYGTVAIEQTITPMPADGMDVKLVIYGTGHAQPDAATQDVMVLWAQTVYGRFAQ